MTEPVQVRAQVPLEAFVSAQKANMANPDKLLSVESTTKGGNKVCALNGKQTEIAQKEQVDIFKEALKAEYSNIDAKYFDELLAPEQKLTPSLIKKSIDSAEEKKAHDHKLHLNETKANFRSASMHSISTIGTDAADAHLRDPDFKPNGVSEANAKNWLGGEDGNEFKQMLKYISVPGESELETVNLSLSKQADVALELIMSGCEEPTKVEFKEGDVLVKITTSSELGQHSLYFTTEEALKQAIQDVEDGKCHSIASAFGLPVGSVNGEDSYVMHKVVITNDCTGWTSVVAPTHEVKAGGEIGKLHTSGGASQVFVGRDNTLEVEGDKAEVTREGIRIDGDGEPEKEDPGIIASIKAMFGWN